MMKIKYGDDLTLKEPQPGTTATEYTSFQGRNLYKILKYIPT